LPENFSVEVRNRREDLAPAIEAAEAWLEQEQVPPNLAYFVNLAIEEIVTNCIQYGYGDDQEHVIRITMSLADRVMTMQIVDDGHAFDPLAAPPPDLTANVADRREGGLGIYLLRKLADDMTYERYNGTNRITLAKRFA
jgi:anti-sigma regulatory factor (Ser/Thr protein kinase)